MLFSLYKVSIKSSIAVDKRLNLKHVLSVNLCYLSSKENFEYIPRYWQFKKVFININTVFFIE